MAEELSWSQEAFNRAFHEVLDQGMAKADFENRVVWLPNAIKHNKPASPNVVTSWEAELDLIPECALKSEAIAVIEEFLNTLGPAYAQAFAAIKKGSRKPLRKPSSKATAIQEQEQQQHLEEHQEQTKSLALTACAVHAAVFITLPLNDKPAFPIDEPQVTRWEQLYPGVNVRQHLRNYAAWADANPVKRKTRQGILGSVNNWSAKEQNKHKPNGELNVSRRQERSRGIEDAKKRALESLG
jgi:hypothetical protein